MADILYDAATHDLVDVKKVKQHLEVDKSDNPIFRNGRLQFNTQQSFESAPYFEDDRKYPRIYLSLRNFLWKFMEETNTFNVVQVLIILTLL